MQSAYSPRGGFSRKARGEQSSQRCSSRASSVHPRLSRSLTECVSARLIECDLLERCRVGKAWNQPESGLLGAWAERVDGAQLVERRLHGPLAQRALDLMEQGLPLRPIELAGLAVKQVLD